MALLERRTTLIVAAMLGLAGITLGVALCVPFRESRYVAANEEIAAELPVYPGAVEVGREHFDYSRNESFWTAGWETQVHYRLPEDVTAEDVTAYFEERATPDWDRGVPEYIGRHRQLLVMCRGGTTAFGEGADRVVVLADDVASLSTYSVSIDHHYKPGAVCLR